MVDEGLVARMPIRNEDLGMVERGRGDADTLVGERLEERDEIGLHRLGFGRRRVEAEHGQPHDDGAVARPDRVRLPPLVASASVEVDYVEKRRLATVMEVRRRERDVAEARDLEGPVGRDDL